MRKSIQEQTVQAAYLLLCFGIALIAISSLTGCAKEITGPAGAQGQQGVQGETGAQGPIGLQGTAGASCTITTVPVSGAAPNGGSLIHCPDGSQGLVLNGSNGTNGSNGSNGTNGTNGANGTNGTIITPVQFCRGTGSYPSTFPEVGFCINNALYAVYSANGGFLTEVLPGTWSSNGIGNSCTFTVAPNCQVTN